jgi:hypothetical protein
MQVDRNGGGCLRPRPNHAQDIRDQAVVLTFVLTLNPEHLTIPDLARSLNGEGSQFKRPDAVERAVRDLVGVGLVLIDGGLIRPTVAALRFIEIIESGV